MRGVLQQAHALPSEILGDVAEKGCDGRIDGWAGRAGCSRLALASTAAIFARAAAAPE